MKEIWKTANELLNKRSKSSNIGCLKDSSLETVHKRRISNETKSFYCSAGKDPTGKIDPSANPFLSGERLKY